ncbi:hypothetical protein [Myxococcus xanthus]|uniref:hypothetical protein n=1 Tax=Myxococcus xanthus TaxID=34 RepID=UPI00112EB1A4|nr:hypothetical protein [Myxococcus xanthus]QDE83293.1 hypothetical protein BHS07_17985 [Myxococcus xanthus]
MKGAENVEDPGGRFAYRDITFNDADGPHVVCVFCAGRVATRLCDAPVPPRMERGKVRHTCDNTLCAESSQRIGKKDYCPSHRREE